MLIILGTSKTVQRGDLGQHGAWYTVDPWSTETISNEITCFTYNGQKGWNVEPQPVIPDVAEFKV